MTESSACGGAVELKISCHASCKVTFVFYLKTHLEVRKQRVSIL